MASGLSQQLFFNSSRFIITRSNHLNNFLTKSIIMKNILLKLGLLALSLVILSAFKSSDRMIPQPEELGNVNWLRDYDKAVASSKETGKPILILFQEVPGCSTCRGYGNNVLSHPLIVEAIEDVFTPLAIHNNKGGKDKKVLESFGEPSWNNPVVRIIDTKRNALTPRINGKYDQKSLVKGMVEALENAKRPVPRYLQLLREHLSANINSTEKATFGMYCFWTGEAKLGSIDGVVDSEPGFMGGREVVSVDFNPEVISYEELVAAARKKKAFDSVFTYSGDQEKVAKTFVNQSKIKNAKTFRADGQPKYYLLHTPYRLIPMLPNQASRVNTAVGQGGDPKDFLSPKQLEILTYVKTNPNKGWKNVYEKPFLAAWDEVNSMF